MRTSVVELLVFEPIASQVSIGVSLSRRPTRELAVLSFPGHGAGIDLVRQAWKEADKEKQMI